jgi:hypothetical protein
MFATTMLLLFLAVYDVPNVVATPLDSQAAQAIHYGRCTRTSNPYQGACRLGNGDILACDYGSVCIKTNVPALHTIQRINKLHLQCLDAQLDPFPGQCTYDDAKEPESQVNCPSDG